MLRHLLNPLAKNRACSRVFVRAFSSSSPLKAQVVGLKDALSSVEKGEKTLIDLRSAQNGVTFKDAVEISYEAFLGSDRGFEEASENFSRDDLLKLVSEEKLGAAQYHEFGTSTLEYLRGRTGNPKLTHQEAQDFVKQDLKQLENPALAAKNFVAQSKAKHAEEMANLKKAFSSGKPSQLIADRIKEKRELFARYLSLNVKDRTRFDDAAEDTEEEAFAAQVLGTLQTVYGDQLTHAAAKETLKSALPSSVLKSDKEFTLKFYLAFAAKLEDARLTAYTNTMTNSAATEVEQEVIDSAAENWAPYLAYKTNPTKKELAADISDQRLLVLSGKTNSNLGENLVAAADAVAKKGISRLPKAPLLLMCSAQAHSDQVAQVLEKHGVQNVSIVEGGADRWLLNGYPCVFSESVQTALDEQIATVLSQAPQGLQDINE